MKVKLIGPGEDHESEHTIDPASAVLLTNQLSKRVIIVSADDGTQTAEPMEITLDDEKVLVGEARVRFFTQGDTFESYLTMQLLEPPA